MTNGFFGLDLKKAGSGESHGFNSEIIEESE